MSRSIAVLVLACSLLGSASLAGAQFSLPLPDLGGIVKQKTGIPTGTPTQTPAPGTKTFAAPTTFRNADRRFEFVIPAGWLQESGDVQSEQGAVFQKSDRSISFTFHMTQMVPSFPAPASVAASLRQANEEMQIKKLLAAKRRDGGVKAPGTPRVIGWEVTESEKGSGGFQRIIWQCYDQDNYYFNFMTATEPAKFRAARAEMQQIINSITFK
ncbi:hypothetical protein DGI_2177 [Megalodesulfovibrio gigas DSM 1382 = ATCC 19364]|uniref:PsbP C-terminal domain-containing protein n=2 Tax=Megalodesulfovibrio gigas TaxID=879 RepID=T2GBG9_MEGG1|nr:hypothetical protein DGI_2177 [Megalodesulfovibrio gigas DSM 1382 = ATCC 19364]